MLNYSCLATEEGNSWDLVSEKDLWEYEDDNLGEDEYVLVKQEDIVEGIACFMAAYLLSLKETKVFNNSDYHQLSYRCFMVCYYYTHQPVFPMCEHQVSPCPFILFDCKLPSLVSSSCTCYFDP